MTDSARPLHTRLKDLWPYLKPQRYALIFLTVLSLISAATSLAQPLLTQQLVQEVHDTGQISVSLIVLLAVLLIVVAVLTGVQQYELYRAAERTVFNARSEIIRKLFHLPIRDYDVRRNGDLVSRVGTDTTMLRAVITSGIIELLGSILVIVGAVVALIFIDFPLFLTVLAVLTLSGVTALVLGGRMQKLALQNQEEVGQMAAAVERGIGAIRTIRAAGATDDEISRVLESAARARDAGIRIGRVIALVSPLNGLAAQIAFLVVVGVGGYRVAAEDLSIANLIAFILFLFMMVVPLGQAFSAYAAVQNALGAVTRIRELTDLPDEEEDEKLTVGQCLQRPSLALQGVRFAYETDEVIRDLSFSAESGQLTALVGPSGGGKSTTFALIERFYELTGGEIRIAGIDIRNLSRATLRGYIAYVEQDVPALAGTLRENLTLGLPNASDDACHQVLRKVKLDYLTTRRSDGLSLQVGDGGVLLSGGERQRIALARCLLTNRPILLLDEPTSSLDARNEIAFQEALKEVAKDRTVLLIAHRLATVMNADKICVIVDGSMEAQGTHAELVQISDTYRELVAHQLLAPAA